MARFKSIRYITYSNRPVDDTLLTSTAKTYNKPIEVLKLDGKWRSHWHKIILLYKDLTSKEDKETYICFLDAYDTLINSPSESTASALSGLEGKVMFGAEANFALTFPEKRKEIKEAYPILHSYYNFLNAGTFIGKSKDVIALIEFICKHFNIDLADPSLLTSPHEDQCYFSILYVLQHQGIVDLPVEIVLDHQQQLFGCTGGRTAAVLWPLTSLFVQAIYFRRERNLLRRVNHLDLQDLLIDYCFKKGTFYNRITKTAPMILHCPGTRSNFRSIIKKAKQNKRLWELSKLKKAGRTIVKARFRSLVLAFKLYRKHRKSNKHLINHFH